MPLANRWNEAMRVEVRYPAEHAGVSRIRSGHRHTMGIIFHDVV